MILGIVFGVIGVGILGCGGFALFAYWMVAVDSDTLVAKSTSDGVASLEIPTNWTPLTGPSANPEASLQMGNLFAETYAMVLSESKAEVASLANNPMAGDDPFGDNPFGGDPFGGDPAGEDGNVSLEQYANLIITNMTTRNPGYSSSPKQSTMLNGMPAYSFTVRGSVEGNSVVFTGMVTEGKRHFHQVLCWTLESREASNMPKLNQVLQSFREN